VIEANRRQVFKTFGLASILVANLFLFVPCTLYFGNSGEFVTPVWSILEVYFYLALLVVGLLIFLRGLLSSEYQRRYAVLIAVVGLLLWLQGNVFVWEYGLLDGQSIDWNHKVWRGWIDIGAWSSVILLSSIFYRVVEKPVIHIAFSVFFLQLVLLVFSSYQNADVLLKKMEASTSVDALREIHQFSSAQNVLLILLDSFQADVFKEIISHKTEGDQYQSALDGFVFFKENMGVFPGTYMSVPAILSGEIYRNHIPKGEFIKAVYGGKTILNSAFESGYEIDLVGEGSMINMYTNGRYTNAHILVDNYHVTEQEYEQSDTAKLLDLTLFRLAPHFLKKYVYNEQRWLVRPFFLNAEYQQFQYFAHTAFLNKLIQNMSVDRTAPVFKFFHLMITHSPMVVNRECDYAGGTLPRNRKTVTAQSKCSLGTVIKLFDKMKELGIYDDSLIILMADHGGHLQPYRFKNTTIDPDSNAISIDPWTMAMATPLMSIKAPGASGTLKISTALTSLLDTPDTISSILNLDERFGGRSVLELGPLEPRERRNYFYEWERDDWESDYNGPIREFIINGSLYDGNWRFGKLFLPPQSTIINGD
jgi:Sulfatase